MKIKQGFVKRKIGDKYLVVTTGELSKHNSMFIELNDTSSEMWDAVANGKSVDEIANLIAEKYGIPFDKAKTDTTKLIEQMRTAQIFEEE